MDIIQSECLLTKCGHKYLEDIYTYNGYM